MPVLRLIYHTEPCYKYFLNGSIVTKQVFSGCSLWVKWVCHSERQDSSVVTTTCDRRVAKRGRGRPYDYNSQNLSKGDFLGWVLVKAECRCLLWEVIREAASEDAGRETDKGRRQTSMHQWAHIVHGDCIPVGPLRDLEAIPPKANNSVCLVCFTLLL